MKTKPYILFPSRPPLAIAFALPVSRRLASSLPSASSRGLLSISLHRCTRRKLKGSSVARPRSSDLGRGGAPATSPAAVASGDLACGCAPPASPTATSPATAVAQPRPLWPAVPIGTTQLSVRSVMLGPEYRHGGTKWHGTTAPPCCIVSFFAVPVPCLAWAARLAMYTLRVPCIGCMCGPAGLPANPDVAAACRAVT